MIGMQRVIVVVAMNCLMFPAASAQPEDALVGQRIASNVVAVDAMFKNGEHERGFGFIVGSAGNRRFVVTAYHVVFGADDPEMGNATVRVIFYTDQEHSRPAEISTHRDVDHDLALLYVDVGSNMPWVRDCLGATVSTARQINVWFLGSGGEWTGPKNPGTLVAAEASQERSQVRIAIDGVQRGTSGAPLLSASGIIGMIQSASNRAATALTIDFIRKRVQDEWKIPWELVPRTRVSIPIFISDKAPARPDLARRGISVMNSSTMTVGYDNGMLVFQSPDRPRAIAVRCQGLVVSETPQGAGTRAVVFAEETRGGNQVAVGDEIDFIYETRRVTGLKQQLKGLCEP